MQGIKKAAVFPDPAQKISKSSKLVMRELTSLGSGNHVVTLQNGRNCVSLDWSGFCVIAQGNVFEHDWVQPAIFELRGFEYHPVVREQDLHI